MNVMEDEEVVISSCAFEVVRDFDYASELCLCMNDGGGGGRENKYLIFFVSHIKIFFSINIYIILHTS